MPLAECGLIGDLGDWALREACSQLATWRHNGLRVPSVSVNLSATNFHNLNLPRMIAATLAEFGLAPGDLMLEITEGVVLDATAGTLRTIAELHRLGVRLSMDDFGTGYSSLGHLRRLIVDELAGPQLRAGPGERRRGARADQRRDPHRREPEPARRGRGSRTKSSGAS